MLGVRGSPAAFVTLGLDTAAVAAGVVGLPAGAVVLALVRPTAPDPASAQAAGPGRSPVRVVERR